MKNLILVIAGMMTAVPMAQSNDTSTLGAKIENATQIASSHEGYAEAFIGGRVEIDQNAGKIRLYPRLYTADAPALVLTITDVIQMRSGAVIYEGIRKVMGSNWQVRITDLSRVIRPAVCHPEYPRRRCIASATQIELRTLSMMAPDPTDPEPNSEVSIFEALPLEEYFHTL